MAFKVYASSGGGVRIGATFGAALEAEYQGISLVGAFDYFVGTSAGSLDAAMTANRWTAEQKKRLFLETDFSKFFKPALVPFGIRKALAVMAPIALDKLEEFYDSLTRRNKFGPPLGAHSGLLINSVDSDDNIQEVYCEKLPPWVSPWMGDDGALYTGDKGNENDRIRWVTGAFSNPDLGLARCMARSSVLPGLVADDPRYMDGGIAENPLLSVLPRDSHVLLIHLGYPGLVQKGEDKVPKGILDRALYAYEFKAARTAQLLMAEFPNLRAIYPQVYNVDSAAFNIAKADKEAMVIKAMHNTREQWRKLKES